MSMCLEAFGDQISRDPTLIDKFFAKKFDMSELLAGAEELGYEFEAADFIKLDDEIHHTPVTANVAFLVADLATGEITELTAEEMELVPAGGQYQIGGVNININVVAVASVIVAIAAAVVVLVL